MNTEQYKKLRILIRTKGQDIYHMKINDINDYVGLKTGLLLSLLLHTCPFDFRREIKEPELWELTESFSYEIDQNSTTEYIESRLESRPKDYNKNYYIECLDLFKELNKHADCSYQENQMGLDILKDLSISKISVFRNSKIFEPFLLNYISSFLPKEFPSKKMKIDYS